MGSSFPISKEIPPLKNTLEIMKSLGLAFLLALIAQEGSSKMLRSPPVDEKHVSKVEIVDIPDLSMENLEKLDPCAEGGSGKYEMKDPSGKVEKVVTCKCEAPGKGFVEGLKALEEWCGPDMKFDEKVIAILAPIFVQMDTNGDCKVTEKESQEYTKQLVFLFNSFAFDVIASMHDNNNQTISHAEIGAFLKTMGIDYEALKDNDDPLAPAMEKFWLLFAPDGEAGEIT